MQHEEEHWNSMVTYTYTTTHKHVYICTLHVHCMYRCTCLQMYMYIETTCIMPHPLCNMYTVPHMILDSVQTNIHVHVYTHRPVHVHVYTHTHIHVYTHTHVHVHVCNVVYMYYNTCPYTIIVHKMCTQKQQLTPTVYVHVQLIMYMYIPIMCICIYMYIVHCVLNIEMTTTSGRVLGKLDEHYIRMCTCTCMCAIHSLVDGGTYLKHRESWAVFAHEIMQL